ncbi:MAG: DUF5050 domain-containing protein [Clostridiales bacterium]|nr:DUF5050 domain-containing protein [Clostridiales bacterium]
MKSKTWIKLTAWVAAIVLNLVIALVYFNVSGLDGGFQTQLTKGSEYAAQGDYDRAIKHFLKAIDIAPDSPVGYIQAADSYERTGQPQQAIALMETLIAKKPRSVESFEYLLRLYEENGAPIQKQIDLLSEAAMLFDSATYADRAGELLLQLSTVGPPVLSLEAGAYSTPQTVHVTNLADGDEVYYTTNGDTPVKTSTKYNPKNGISLKKGKTLVTLLRYSADGAASQPAAYLFTIGEGMTAEERGAYTAQNGNNLSNGGTVVFAGNNTYYSNLNKSGFLYSQSDGLLVEDKASYLNLSGGFIYYVNGSDGNRVYRVRVDGTERERVLSAVSGPLLLANDRLIFQNRSEDSSLYSATLSGGSLQRITPDLATSIAVYEGDVYYRNDSKGGALYRSSLDGIDHSELVGGACGGITVDGGYVYYISAGEDGRIYRVPTGGGTPEAVTGASASEFVLAGGNLYFRDAAQGGIYRCSTSGGSATRLTTVDGAKLNVSGSTLYFVNYADGSSHYTMSTSGGNLTKLGT